MPAFGLELILVPLVSHAVTHWASKAMPLIDDRLRSLFARADEDPAAAKEAEQLLATRIRENPEEARTLVATVISAPRDPDAPTEQLAYYGQIIDGMLNAIQVVRPAVVVLPGFFHGELVTTVIDARSSRSGPSRTWPSTSVLDRDTADEGFMFFDREDAELFNIPQAYVIAAEDEEERDVLVTRISSCLTDDALPSPFMLHWKLHELAGIPEERVRRVTWIREGSVETEDLHGREAATLPITGPGGIRLARDALITRILEHDRKVLEWRQEAEGWGDLAEGG